MTRIAPAAAILIGALLLAGCSSANDVEVPAASDVQAESFSAESQQVAPEGPADSKSVEECDPERSYLDPDSDMRDEVDPVHLDCSYLESVHRVLAGLDSVSNETLVDWGHEACSQYDEGKSANEIRIAGSEDPAESEPNWNSTAIANSAAFVYCPEYSVPAA